MSKQTKDTTVVQGTEVVKNEGVKVERNVPAIFSQEKNLSVLSSDELVNVFDSFEGMNEGIEVTCKYAKSSMWAKVEGSPIQLLYTQDTTIEGDKGEQLSAVQFYARLEGQKEPGLYVSAASVLNTALRGNGFGMYEVTYLGKERGTNFQYDNFSVKLLATIKK